ncbi:MAG: vitamin K epoxide reductase family protein [Chloroflexi bacterium]|nr:vitamin K epoxide reductase family protein [Chloroflexota bacterium]
MHIPQDWQLRLIQLLTIPGMIIAYFLLLYHNGNLFSICEPGGFEDCGLVSGPGAPYSAIGPIPVALIGLVGYFVIFLSIWLAEWVDKIEEYLPEIMVGLTGLAFLFTAYLTTLELIVIRAYCRYCLMSAGIITIMLILAVSYLIKVNRDSEQSTVDSGQ